MMNERNDGMNRIERYYDSISTKQSPEQLARDIMKKADSSAKKRSFRPLAAVAAAAVVLVGGVTAAAATGLLNINELFGGRISTQDEQFAGELVGAAQDFQWTTSDDDYVINLKGVTGSERDMLLLYEIARADGRPVTEYMTNIPEDGELDCAENLGFDLNAGAFKAGNYRYHYSINDDGNIDVYNLAVTDGDISGQQFYAEVINLYPKQLLSDFEAKHDIFDWAGGADTPAGFYRWGDNEAFDAGQPCDVALNDERIIGLELEWTIEFTYSPSDTAKLSKVITDEKSVVSLNYEKSYGGVWTYPLLRITDSYFSSVSGRIDLVREGYMRGQTFDTCNDIYLLLENGDKISCTAFTGVSSYDRHEKMSSFSVEIQYSEELNGPITAVDISKVEAISINGEVFSLI